MTPLLGLSRRLVGHPQTYESFCKRRLLPVKLTVIPALQKPFRGYGPQDFAKARELWL